MTELVHVEGLAPLAQQLRDFAPRLRRKILGAAVREAARVIRDEAKQRAPVWTGPVSRGHPPPGTLKREIIYKRLPEQSTAQQEVYAVTVRRRKQRAYYWFFVEFGTVNMSARPYLRPAFEAKARAAIEALRDKLRDDLPEATKP